MGAALATGLGATGAVRLGTTVAERRFGRSRCLASVVGLLVALGLGWPAVVGACSCKAPPGRDGYSAARSARNLFIGDVVVARRVRLLNGTEMLAYLVRVRAAWNRALPEYVVVETGLHSCAVHLRVGDRDLFEFSVCGHAGLDRPPERRESDADGWAWELRFCESTFEVHRIGIVEVLPGGHISFDSEGRMRDYSTYPETYTGRGPWTEPAALREADRRETQLIGELTRILGPPLPAPPRTKVATFEEFAQAYVGATNRPAWPADWEYAVAAAFQLSHLLGVDHSTEVLVYAPHTLLPWDLQPRFQDWELLAQVIEQVANATFVPRPSAIWQTFLGGLVRLVQDLANRKPVAPNTAPRPLFVQVDMVRSAQLLLRLPRNWRDFPAGMVFLDDVELHKDCRAQRSPSAACIWIDSLAERHQEALHGLGMAYLRHVLISAGVPWVDGKPTMAPVGQPPP